MKRKTLLSVLAAAAVAGLGWWYRSLPSHGPHLLLITLDTTRADRLGCYGYDGARTPVLDALAAEGVLFEQASTVAPITQPAHASLFTGFYPKETGIRWNGQGRLPESFTTLASVLKARGYDTGAFIGAVVLNRSAGMNQGFDTYDDDFADPESPLDPLDGQRAGARVVDAALKWLSPVHRRPWFCWVHLFDCHNPYVAHPELFGKDFDDRLYDGELAYVDRQVGKLVDFLKSRKMDGETLVVVVGDHGESLGEHDESSHGFSLYQAAMHVPLLFRHGGQLQAGRRVASRVSMVDISPTILKLLEVDDTRKDITGRSFHPALLGKEVPSSLCFGVTDYPYVVSGCVPLRSLIDADWKYIRSKRPELYNLADDPHELMNLAEIHPEKVRELDTALTTFDSNLQQREAAEAHLSTAERNALRNLNYLGGSGGEAVPTDDESLKNLLDIKDMLKFNDQMDTADDLVKKGKIAEGIADFRRIVAEAPTHRFAALRLSNALCIESRFDEAIDVLRRLSDIAPNFPDAYFELGTVLFAKGRFDEAIEAFQKAIELSPQNLEARDFLAKSYARTDRPDQALAEYREALRIAPDSIQVRLWRARLLVGLKRIDEAIADCREAVRLGPASAAAHHDLGMLLGNSREARKHLVQAVELDPNSAQFRRGLAAFLMGQGQYDEAVEHLTRAAELQPGDAETERLIRIVMRRPQ